MQYNNITIQRKTSGKSLPENAFILVLYDEDLIS